MSYGRPKVSRGQYSQKEALRAIGKRRMAHKLGRYTPEITKVRPLGKKK